MKVEESKQLKRRNHEVPRGLLKNWLSSSGGQQGYHYWDYADFTRKFEKGTWANFAVTEYLYVPYISSTERSDALEDWFSIDENGLARLAVAAHSGQSKSFSSKIMSQAIRASIGLGYRSAYQFHCAAKVLEAHDPDRHVHGMMVENVSHVLGKKFSQFSNWDFLVLHSLPVDLLISERPFHDWTIRPNPHALVTMPLAPNAMLVGTPPKNEARREMSIAWEKADDRRELAEQQNHFTIENARQWIVSRASAQIDGLSLEMSGEKLDARKKFDRYIVRNL